jgi:hypothetical protein
VGGVQVAPAIPKGSIALGEVPAAAAITGEVVLRPRDDAALRAFISEVSNKNSAQYQQYLAPGEFAKRFGPLPGTVAAVRAQLRADGLVVATAVADGMILEFRGSAERVEAAFGTGLRRYHLPDGTTGQAATSNVQLPSAIAGSVSAVVGLNDLVHLRPALRGGPAALGAPTGRQAVKAAAVPLVAGAPAACVDATKAATRNGGLTDDQIAYAYGAFGLYRHADTGVGQHIAVYELEPFLPSDLRTFDTCYFGSTRATTMAGRVSVLPVDGGQPAGPGSGEAVLDVEDVSALAPGAHLDVYEAPNSAAGAIDAYSRIVNNDADQMVTTSWGLCESELQQIAPGMQQAENLLFQQAAAQGQSILAASGDSGSDDCNPGFYEPVSPVLSVDDPASQPYVVSVGGTTIDNATTPPSEHVWNDAIAGGAGGGGISASWPMPIWQLDAKVPGIDDPATISAADAVGAADAANPGFAFCLSGSPGAGVGTACREVPDVSAQADEFTGAVTIYSSALGPGPAGWTTIGGTSSAAPIWAALLALVNASNTSSACTAPGRGVGFVGPLLYAVASDPTTYHQSFNDITTGGNDPLGFSGLFPATAGYDMASGLGSPLLTSSTGGTGLASNLCKAAVSASRPIVAGLSPNVVPTGGEELITIHGSGFAPGGVPDVAHVQVGTYQLPAAGSPYTFNVVDAGTITAVVPPAVVLRPPGDVTDGAAGYQVSVTLRSGESSLPSPAALVEYVDQGGGGPLPAVTGVRTFAGPESGGNSVDIFGTGFAGAVPASAVTFGNVAAPAFQVLNDFTIRATVPPMTTATSCAQDGSSFKTGETAANDICQVHVVVANPNGSSGQSTILPLYESPPFFDDSPMSDQELAPQPDEYDYLPAPTITSISTSDGPASLASELGGSIVTLKGSGFNLIGLDFVAIGDPNQEFSQSQVLSVTGTEIQAFAPPLPEPTVGPAALPVTVITAAGMSPALFAVYAGIPVVGGVVATSGPTAMRTTAAGTPGGPDTGGTAISISGAGFSQQTLFVGFVDALPGFSYGMQQRFTVANDEAITTATVPQNPGRVDVEVCTVTLCSANTAADRFILFPPGAPHAQSATPASGPATGGTKLVITGANLGCVTGVSFGSTPARSFSNPFTPTPDGPGALDCGQTTAVKVIAPPLPAGTRLPKTVRVTVTTAESVLSRDVTVTTATFTYRPVHPLLTAASPPRIGTVSVAYGPYRFRATGAPAPAFVVSSGVLPPGLSLSHITGLLSGRPTRTGRSTFRVTAANGTAPAAVSPATTITIQSR